MLPQLEGFAAYNTRVAANSLAIVARQLQLQPELDRLDLAYARQAGLDPSAGPIPQQLARALKNRALAPDASFLSYLRQRALKALEIDNPKFSVVWVTMPMSAGSASSGGGKMSWPCATI